MQIGNKLLVRHNGLVLEGIVTNFYEETIEIKLANEEVITRKYWEVRAVQNEK